MPIPSPRLWQQRAHRPLGLYGLQPRSSQIHCAMLAWHGIVIANLQFISQSYCRMWIWSHRRSIEWRDFEWPWMILTHVSMSRCFSNVNISKMVHFRYKMRGLLQDAYRKPQTDYRIVLAYYSSFGHLEWPADPDFQDYSIFRYLKAVQEP